MIATDGSEGAERALATAAELVKAESGELLILTVSEDGFSREKVREFQSLGMAESDALEEIDRQILMRATARAQDCGVTNIKTRECVGDPAEMIIETAQREHVEAIVMGRRGRGRLAGLLLGSVSQKIASLAPCVVIIVP